MDLQFDGSYGEAFYVHSLDPHGFPTPLQNEATRERPIDTHRCHRTVHIFCREVANQAKLACFHPAGPGDRTFGGRLGYWPRKLTAIARIVMPDN
jgi:hypothetical protein